MHGQSRRVMAATLPPQHQRWLRDFGYNVRHARERAGITQEVLAHRSSLHVTYVSGVERGQRNLSLVNIHRLAQALGVRAGDLLSLD